MDHIWTIENWEQNIDFMEEGHRTGFRLRFDSGIDPEVRRACKEFAVFLRKEYFFPLRVVAYIKNKKKIRATSEQGDEKSLRGSSQEIAQIMCRELQEKVENAGIQILEVRITHLAYAPEIASAMLQRQQAAAIIDARQKIVEGAVGMVEMALDKLNENDIVELDEERKAAMVSNLLVVLCGNKDAQPIVNSGSLY